MEDICPINKCTGCGACAQVCAHSAITLQPDACGYMYPLVEEEKCANCGLCQKSCPSLSFNERHYPINSLAVTCKSEEETLSCASGGAATLLSIAVIKQGGVVYGCDGTDIRNVHHVRVDRVDELKCLKGSKYVQSFMGDTYKNIKADLQVGLKVFFIGTPCQVAGLYGFLHYKVYENLYTADLVCHGVPSQQMLNDNIDLYTENKGDECIIRFREKLLQRVKSKRDAVYRITYGWFFQNQPYVKAPLFRPYKEDPYMLGFISGLTFRPNCYECRYASVARVADLTLSDFWGLSENAGFDKGKGVSNILVNTNQGQKLWDITKTDTIFKERSLMESVNGNGQLNTPSMRHPEHDRFVSLYPKVGFEKAVRDCSITYLEKEKIRTVVKSLLSFAKKVIR